MAGEIKPIRQNALQRLLNKFIARRSVINFFATRMHVLDFFVLKLTRGKYAISEIAGWTIIQLTTTGAKTGQERTMPLLAGVDGDRLAVVASSFGREHNPSWYYNLKKTPECKVTYKQKTMLYLAREASGEEYDKYWKIVSSSYPSGFAYYERTAPRHIPVMVLEPKNSSTTKDTKITKV